jgi:hypothetical protein
VNPDRPLDAALAPLRAAMLTAARQDADRELDAAAEEERSRLAMAEAEVDQTRAQARARGAADAAAVVARQRSQAQARARSLLLATRRDEYRALRDGARSAMARLHESPEYPELCERMIRTVRGLLGPDAHVEEADGGGVVGTAPGRRVDYTLRRVADRVLDEVATGLESP